MKPFSELFLSSRTICTTNNKMAISSIRSSRMRGKVLKENFCIFQPGPCSSTSFSLFHTAHNKWRVSWMLCMLVSEICTLDLSWPVAKTSTSSGWTLMVSICSQDVGPRLKKFWDSPLKEVEIITCYACPCWELQLSKRTVSQFLKRLQSWCYLLFIQVCSLSKYIL